MINPFFPANLAFDWEQIVQIAVIGNHDPSVQVGNEWYPMELGRLLVENAVIFLAIFAAFVRLGSMIYEKVTPPDVSDARRRDIACITALAIFFLLMTLRQARQKEYFLPLALFVGALLGDALLLDTRATFDRLHVWAGKWFRPLLVSSVAFVTLLSLHGVWYARKLYVARTPFTHFAAVGAWTRTHVPAGEIIFHGAWDDFPYVFYRDVTHRYIAGMDPMFFYRNDPAKYWLWRDIGDGRRRNPSDLILNDFHARYVFTRRAHDALRPIIEKDPSVERVYADDEAEVWKITR